MQILQRQTYNSPPFARSSLTRRLVTEEWGTDHTGHRKQAKYSGRIYLPRPPSYMNELLADNRKSWCGKKTPLRQNTPANDQRFLQVFFSFFIAYL